MAEISRLPAPTFDFYDWQLEGACREADLHLFFHPEGERGPAKLKREEAALEFCARCPVIEQCREHVLATREEFGVWGGLTEVDRDRIFRPHHARTSPSRFSQAQ